MKVLGFSVGHHKGAALIIDGELKVAITEERLTRLKGDGAYKTELPIHSIDYCLSSQNLRYEDVDLFVYNTVDNDKVMEQFISQIGLDEERLVFVPHHLAHAYSTFYSSDFDEAAVVVADAMGNVITPGSPMERWLIENNYEIQDTTQEPFDWAEGASIFHFTKNGVKEVWKKWIGYPFVYGQGNEFSIGAMYGEGALQLVYDEKSNNWQAGKLMGLASYADKNFVDTTPDFTQYSEDNFTIPLSRIRGDVNYKSDFSARANVAGLYQREQETASLHLCGIAKNLTKSKNVCVAGGSFLNCNTNEKIILSKKFKGTYFVPAADDSGIPLGCAWYGYVEVLKGSKKDKSILNPYTGKSYTNQDVLDAIDFIDSLTPFRDKIDVFVIGDENELIGIAANYLNDNKVIGWFQGGAELGPRALGGRSILATPKHVWMKEYINNDIKKREWYRPFAPSVLFEKQSEIFNLNTYSPYMLVTTTVKKKWKDLIPGVVHIDGTSRYQSVTEENNPRYYKLIKQFNNVSSIPLVINTSFNGKDEPIVETPLDAINSFWKNNLFALIINDIIIKRK